MIRLSGWLIKKAIKDSNFKCCYEGHFTLYGHLFDAMLVGFELKFQK